MFIYVVEQGDTIYSIADRFGVTVNQVIQDNGLENPHELVVGQTIVIVYPKQTHTVQEGDTLNSIADSYNASPMQLLRNNPQLSDRKYIYPGETIVISYNTNGSITTNGFAYPYIKRDTLVKILPNLTYLSVFNYTAVEGGNIISYHDDAEVVQMSKNYGVIPLMMLATLSSQGEPNKEIAYEILLNEEYQKHHINTMLEVMRAKGYQGINIVFNYLSSSNQSLYEAFIKNVSERLQQEGYLFFITINYRIEKINNNVFIEPVNYSNFIEYVNGITLLQFVWGNNYGPPAPVSNINDMIALIDYLVTMVSPDKIIVGIPLIGYDWELPYVPGKSITNSLSLNSAIDLANDVGTTIQFDEISQTPYFLYNQINIGIPSQHIVWTMDARSMDALAKIVKQNALSGSGIWNIMIYYPVIWTIINSQYDVVKITD